MENTYQAPAEPENLLDDLEVTLVKANSSKRLANYFIDLVCFYLFLFLVFWLYAVAFGAFHITDAGIGLRVMIIVLYVFYYSASEAIGNGKTIGKMMTQTRAVNEDGTPITGQTAILRSLCRLLPFEPFSAFGNPAHPWHDRLTTTCVIDERYSRLPSKDQTSQPQVRRR